MISKIKAVIYSIGASIKKLVPDVLAASGTVCISYGAFLIYHPLGYIIGGALLIGGAIIWSKSE
ncbi:MAG: hypothetical protein K0R90_1353 [Oscillospiraceae bacterium]|jgi:hypothetical protein|nr:hypothetical protein [Oscillospiraceae bacterium]